MNAMYCILKGFSLYNFGNKFVFIVIVIVIECTSVASKKGVSTVTRNDMMLLESGQSSDTRNIMLF